MGRVRAGAHVRGSMAQLKLRPWRSGDEEALVRHADNRKVWRNLTNNFPSPYTRVDAVAWIAHANSQPLDACHHAIELDGEAVGGVGFARLADLNTLTAEIGYWVGERFWGRGLATEALLRHTELAFAEYDFARLQAGVLDWNPASCRVLEKAGYHLESRQRRNVFKDDAICDTLLYVKLRP